MGAKWSMGRLMGEWVLKLSAREQQELNAKDYVRSPELSARIAASSLELSRTSVKHNSNPFFSCQELFNCDVID
jgi:hypothetical protein